METNKIYNKNNEEILKQLPNNSIDLFLEDPPYGLSNCEWDCNFDIKKYWELRKDKIKKTGTFLVFGQELFSSRIRLSNLKDYKYDIYWQKERLTNIFQVRKRPGKVIENIMVFYGRKNIYNPQKTKHKGRPIKNKIKKGLIGEIIAGKNCKIKPYCYKDDTLRWPLQIVKFQRDVLKSNLHPTQKPLLLIEYLIKTFTHENMIVFDGFCGSGTTALACKNLNRKFICCEINKKYCNISIERTGL